MKEGTIQKKGLGIKAKMLLFILPPVLVAFIVMAFISSEMSRSQITEVTTNYVESELDANVGDINGELEKIRTTAQDLSSLVGSTYETVNMKQYKKIFSDIILSNDLVLGSGIWFEPKVYTGDKDYLSQEYTGPYWYRDENNKIVEDWEYSNAEYDYFSQEYYLNAKAQSTLTAVITDPYFDPASNSVMASCSAPIFDQVGNFIGCITVDVSLDTISELVGSIKVGKNGVARMVASDGTYIYTDDASKVAAAMNIAQDTDSISSIASKITGEGNGNASYKSSSGKMNAYYETVPGVNWKLIVLLPDSEINEASDHMRNVIIVICAVAMLVCIIFIFYIATTIAGSLKVVDLFAKELSEGNFMIDEVRVKSHDELGHMSGSLNDMYRSNRDIIAQISNESGNVNDAANTLSAMSEELSAEFSKIQDNMNGVNDAMMSTGAATQEVSASVQEVNDSVEGLSKETSETAEKVKEITQRALKIRKENEQAHDNAISITNARRSELEEANKKAEVVSEIASLADSIAAIASQIDLLSLNASIEAARAGEAGKGFAVVASEINNLATQTNNAVDQIKVTINSVQEAFKDLSAGSNKLLDFVTGTVTPDYENFVKVGDQYGNDAALFGELAQRIEDMTNSIKTSMNEVNSAVMSIAESTQETSTRSADITASVDSVSQAVDSVAEMAMNQQHIAGELTDIVSHFKIK
ncbi:MAG: methyl-accepting chemotaxis protein [Lachnospiraceae bacterium]|nr:methyl-accepting chemotaxis protein [Lachnospiraceae bacterium]